MIPIRLNQSHVIASNLPLNKKYPLACCGPHSLSFAYLQHHEVDNHRTVGSTKSGSRTECPPFAQSTWPSRSFRVVICVMILAFLNAVDLEFTLLALTHGLLFEANPIASYLLSTQAQFITYKVTFAGLGIFMLLTSRRTTMGEIAALMICSFYVILVYQWMACFSMFQAAYSGDSLL